MPNSRPLDGASAPADTALEERPSAARTLSGWWAKAFSALAILTTVYHVLALTVVSMDPWLFLGFSLGLFWILAFLIFPATPAGRHAVQPLDLALCAAALGAMVYLGLEYEGMYLRTGFEPSTADWIFGLTAVALTVEMSRRVLGWTFPGMALGLIAYALWGGALPGFLGHRGYEFDRTMATLVSTEGVYGFAMSAAATYIVLFVTFGAFLRATHVGQFFIQLATALAGRQRGGPAKVAIFASAMFGTISGSSMGNVAAVGTFTIPLMKRVGYRAEFAAAVEAAASTGGQLMPPVMGSVAFVLAEATQTPYRDVMLAALIPAICYFAAMWFVIDFEAVKRGLRATPAAEMPRLIPVLRDGWLLLVPIATLVTLMVFGGRSVVQSAVVSVLVAIAVDFARRRRFMSRDVILKAFKEGATGSIEAVAACACAGILVGVFVLTGLGNRFVDLVLAYGQNHLAATLVIVMLVTIVLGFPLPTVPAYILTAAVGAPVMVKLGVPMLAAHLFIMYYACVSTLTPPVALAAFTAAGIAGSDPNRTGWVATRLSIAAYIVPFVFIFNPAILWTGAWMDILRATIMAFAGAYGLAGAANGNTGPVSRIVMFAAAVAVLNQDGAVVLAGIAALAIVLAWQGMLARRAARPVDG
jgi:TRAP transporter 4TM/12TM fusion protein